MKYEGRKTLGRDKLYVQDGEGLPPASMSRYSLNIDKAK